MSGQSLGKVLVIRGGALGDFLLTLPVLRALRGASSHLEILGYPSFVELARDRGLVDAGRSIEYGPMAAFFARGAVQDPALRGYFASFDLVLSYLYDPDGIFAENLRAAGVKRFVQGPHKPSGRARAVDELSAPLQRLGLGVDANAAHLNPPTTPAPQTTIALHPGSGSPAKNWPAANWRDLAQKLLAAYPHARLVIIRGEADGKEVGSLGSLRQNPRAEFWENRPLVELARRLEAVGGYIGHDTGVSHLAAVLAVPSILLFGPTDPSVWAPPHDWVGVLRAPDKDLAQLEVATVLTAIGKHIGPRLLATPHQNPQNPAS